MAANLPNFWEVKYACYLINWRQLHVARLNEYCHFIKKNLRSGNGNISFWKVMIIFIKVIYLDSNAKFKQSEII